MPTLHTIGYEGADLAGFRRALRTAGVRTLIDVRDVPISRKRGFSKNQLRAALADDGIAYLHLRWLGNPKPGREAGRAGDIATYHRIYFARLASAEAQGELAAAAATAQAGAACLMCFERDPTHCHRTLVANALAERHGFAVNALDAGPS